MRLINGSFGVVFPVESPMNGAGERLARLGLALLGDQFLASELEQTSLNVIQ